MKKKLLLGLLSVGFVLGLATGCGVEKHTENIDETYKDYWNYSLGDYEVSYVESDDNGSNGSGGFTTNKWYDYTFTFRDINNNSRNITISNYNIKDFNDEISLATELFLADDVRKLFANNSNQVADGITILHNSIFCNVERIDKNINLYDSQNGLKFNELSLNTLNQNNINLEIKISINLNGNIDDYPNLKQILINDINFIFQRYGYSNIKFKFTISPSDDWYKTEYYLNFDGYNYNWETQYYGENK